MIFETERLFFREMTEKDLPALRRILQDADVMYAYEHAFSEQEVLDWLSRQQDRYRKDGFGLWAAVQKESGVMIGQAGLTLQDAEGKQLLEIGYLFQKAYWHQGYAIEAAAGCKAYAFEHLGADRVYSIIRENNRPSQKVAIRNGMRVVGRFTKHYYGIDMPHDIYCAECGQSVPQEDLLSLLSTAARLKDTTRHSWTGAGRHESVAEHSWCAALMALLLRDTFPSIDMDKVIQMCLLHDLGEAFTGDIPTFEKTSTDTARENSLLRQWIGELDLPLRRIFEPLFAEMEQCSTEESKFFRALDRLEAVIQHNSAPLETWLPLEYALQRSYGKTEAAPFPYLKHLQSLCAQIAAKKAISAPEADPR